MYSGNFPSVKTKTNTEKLLIYSKLIMGCRQRLVKRYYISYNPFSWQTTICIPKHTHTLSLSLSRLRYIQRFYVWTAIYHVSTWKMSRHSMEWQIESSHCYISLSVGSSRKVDARFTIYTKSLGSYKRINAK